MPGDERDQAFARIRDKMAALKHLETDFETFRTIERILDERLELLSGIDLDAEWDVEISPSTANRLQSILQTVFKLESFRANQLDIISVCTTRSDVFVLMPTGGGKSLCYQLPAIHQNDKSNTTTLVVEPLVALINDQVHALRELGVFVASITGDSTYRERQEILRSLNGNGRKPALLYITPERLSGSDREMQDALAHLQRTHKLERFVMDEAHTLKTWDFRKANNKIQYILREQYPNVPVTALTATASPSDMRDIIASLGMVNTRIFLRSVNRPNLFYTLKQTPSTNDCVSDIVLWIKGHGYEKQCGIIYCTTQKQCKNLAEQLRGLCHCANISHCEKQKRRKQHAHITAQPYHGGMTAKERKWVHSEWQDGRCKIVCATTAFGLGVDKPDGDWLDKYQVHELIQQASSFRYSSSCADDCREVSELLQSHCRQRPGHVFDARRLFLCSDKGMSDVRQRSALVFAHGVCVQSPDPATSYFQETGRAGRDGLPAHCLCFFSIGELQRTSIHFASRSEDPAQSQRIRDAAALFAKFCAEQHTCRRVLLLRHFGEEFDAKDCQSQCDNCVNKGKLTSKDFTEEAYTAMSFVNSVQRLPMPKEQRITIRQCLDVLRGVSLDISDKKIRCQRRNHSLYGAWKHLAKSMVPEQIFDQLLSRLALVQKSAEISGNENKGKKDKYNHCYVELGPRAQEFLSGTATLQLVFPLVDDLPTYDFPYEETEEWRDMLTNGVLFQLSAEQEDEDEDKDEDEQELGAAQKCVFKKAVRRVKKKADRGCAIYASDESSDTEPTNEVGVESSDVEVDGYQRESEGEENGDSSSLNDDQDTNLTLVVDIDDSSDEEPSSDGRTGDVGNVEDDGYQSEDEDTCTAGSGSDSDSDDREEQDDEDLRLEDEEDTSIRWVEASPDIEMDLI